MPRLARQTAGVAACLDFLPIQKRISLITKDLLASFGKQIQATLQCWLAIRVCVHLLATNCKCELLGRPTHTGTYRSHPLSLNALI
jgi:hypothetical protein